MEESNMSVYNDIKEGITTLETTIKTNIKDNSQQEITGQKLQDVLVAIKDNIEEFKNARENIYKAFNEKFFNKTPRLEKKLLKIYKKVRKNTKIVIRVNPTTACGFKSIKWTQKMRVLN